MKIREFIRDQFKRRLDAIGFSTHSSSSTMRGRVLMPQTQASSSRCVRR